LAFKEALTNVVRHAGATEVRLSIQVEDRQLRLSIADNGRGLPASERTQEMGGVANMRARIERLGIVASETPLVTPASRPRIDPERLARALVGLALPGPAADLHPSRPPGGDR